MAEKNKREITGYEKEKALTYQKIKQYKTSAEANIIGLFWKNPDFYFTYNIDEINLDSFHENMWKVYYQIGYDVVVKEKKVLDNITINFYLEKHPKLSEKYDEYGGYEAIQQVFQYLNVKNINGYIAELHKWQIVINLLKTDFPVAHKIKEFTDMTSEEIYNEYEAYLNHIFVNSEEEIVSYGIEEGIDDLIEELNEGIAIGLPYHNLEILNKETSGMLVGNITLVGALSGVGKSTWMRNVILPSIVEHNEKIIIMLNEEGVKKWQREFLAWVANNIYKEELHKYTIRNGNYTKETKELLVKCANWIKEKQESQNIRIIPFKQFTSAKVCKVMKKYASLGIKHYIVDTFKADAGSKSNNNWLDMQQAMVDIGDVVKPENKNLHVTITFQLEKGSAKQRYYTQNNIGMAKNIVDVASTCIMMRNLFSDEYEGGKNKLYAYRLEGKNNKSKIPVVLSDEKKYQLIFVVKNREGTSNDYQIVVEHDLSTNTIKEVGMCICEVDF